MVMDSNVQDSNVQDRIIRRILWVERGINEGEIEEIRKHRCQVEEEAGIRQMVMERHGFTIRNLPKASLRWRHETVEGKSFYLSFWKTH
jgi:hypothetical protein